MNKPSIPASVYTHEYYETCCQGHEEFSQSLGANLTPRLAIPIELANITPNMKIVDVGCGRGEVVLHSARKGALVWGIDYAFPAVQIAKIALIGVTTPVERQIICLSQSNVRNLPFASKSIDLVFMLDVVEHLFPYELDDALKEIFRILRPGGRIVIHTMPNFWYYKWGYPIYRSFQGLRGGKLPKDPRDRWSFNHVHVNEQTPITLYAAVQKCGFRPKIWLQTTQNYSYEPNKWVRWAMSFLVNVYPFRWIFCNDIFAIGTKP